jgi:glycosyltransferase involved in cell wall biosynthesis
MLHAFSIRNKVSGDRCPKPEAARRLAMFMFGDDAPGSGTLRQALALAGACAVRGYRVDAVVVRPGDALRAELPPDVRLVDLGAWAAGARRWWRVMVYGSVPALARYLRREHPGVMLSTASHINPAAALAWRLAGVDTRLVLRESNHAPAARVRSRLAHRFYRWADAIAAVSDGVAAYVAAAAAVPRQRVVTIYNGVAIPELLRQAQVPLVHPWFSPGAPPVILGVGRLMPQKDFPMLVRAFARVRARRAARLLILGHGDSLPLQQLAAHLGVGDDVSCPGFVSNPFQFMARASVFVLSSAWEGFPSVLIEALACGCPVVSTDCPSGPAELLDRGAFGPLVPVGDDVALADAILSALAAPTDRERLRARAAQFSVDAVAEQFIKLVSAMCVIG